MAISVGVRHIIKFKGNLWSICSTIYPQELISFLDHLDFELSVEILGHLIQQLM